MPLDIYGPARRDRNCSLGWLAIEWIEALVLHGAGDVVGEITELTDDQVEFIVDIYCLAKPGEEDEGRRLATEVLWLAPKGSDKSGFAAKILLFEAMGPCRFAGWAEGGEVYRDPWGLGFEYVYEPGEPMGKPVSNPSIRMLATSEDQTFNTYETARYNCKEGPLAGAMNNADDAGLSRIKLPDGGDILPSSSGGRSKDGGRETCVVVDESHLFVLQEHVNLYSTIARNLHKRAGVAEPLLLSTSTYFDPAEGSVCQGLLEKVQGLQQKKDRGKKVHPEDDRYLVHWRHGEIDPEDLHDREKLAAALKEAYGGCHWIRIPTLVSAAQDEMAKVEDTYRYWLNTASVASNAWIAPYEWGARGPIEDPESGVANMEGFVPKPGDTITLGFDGSRRRRKGVTDATALIGCRVSDGLVFPIPLGSDVSIWEQPANYRGTEGWEVPADQVQAAVVHAFKTYNVVGFYADPAKWEGNVAQWERMFGPSLKVKSSGNQPIAWWMTGMRSTTTVRALSKFQNGVLDNELKHNGDPTLAKHVANARQFDSSSGVQIRKDHPNSPRKIDAAVAAVLAWQCRLDAVSRGIGPRKKQRVVRIR
jgi:phage terminase large subunit-like protein